MYATSVGEVVEKTARCPSAGGTKQSNASGVNRAQSMRKSVVERSEHVPSPPTTLSQRRRRRRSCVNIYTPASLRARCGFSVHCSRVVFLHYSRTLYASNLQQCTRPPLLQLLCAPSVRDISRQKTSPTVLNESLVYILSFSIAHITHVFNRYSVY